MIVRNITDQILNRCRTLATSAKIGFQAFVSIDLPDDESLNLLSGFDPFAFLLLFDKRTWTPDGFPHRLNWTTYQIDYCVLRDKPILSFTFKTRLDCLQILTENKYDCQSLSLEGCTVFIQDVMRPQANANAIIRPLVETEFHISDNTQVHT